VGLEATESRVAGQVSHRRRGAFRLLTCDGAEGGVARIGEQVVALVVAVAGWGVLLLLAVNVLFGGVDNLVCVSFSHLVLC